MVLEELKATVRTAQVRAHVVVNTELLQLYWRIGRAISQRRDVEGWGTKIVARLAGDLRREFPEMSGFSQRSLTYMRTFAEAWPATRFAQQPVAQLPWGHVTVLLDRLAEQPVREWYAVHAAASGWSRAVLLNQIKSQLHTRLGAAPSNFRAALPATDSDLAIQLIKDPYNFEFLGVTGVLAERDLERRLMEQIQQFLLELGEGFALCGRQYRFSVGRKDFVIDLVFFNVTHNRFLCTTRCGVG